MDILTIPRYQPWWGPRSYHAATAGTPKLDGEPGREQRLPMSKGVVGRYGLLSHRRGLGQSIHRNYGAATRGSCYKNQAGRSTVAGRGYNTNVYTVKTGGYQGAATFNPNTGIVAGGDCRGRRFRLSRHRDYSVRQFTSRPEAKSSAAATNAHARDTTYEQLIFNAQLRSRWCSHGWPKEIAPGITR
jgi:hypothetical protein